MNSRVWRPFVLVFSLLAGSHSAFGQAGTSVAQLNGSIRDEKGGSVAKAAVSLRDLDTNHTYTTNANENGFYVLPSLPPGRYELKASFTGFSTYTQTGIALTIGQTATIDVTLKVASVGEQVVVTSETPPVEPTRTEISQVIDTKQIQDLPISGRLFTDFALLTPGVATGRTSLQSTITEFEVTRISFGGMRDLSNAVTVDGADTINTASGSQRATPSQEAVSEFRVVNNGFGAENGRALGGIVNIITKSGTNDLHGSVYDYLQNDATDARSLLQPAPQANTLRQNQFGATLGGPIKKDKTFFFANYEGQRRGESPTYPQTLLGDLNLINSAKALLGLPPENLNVLKTKDTDNALVKIDHQINANNRLSARYNIFDGRELNLLVGDTLDGGGIGAPSSGHNAFIRDQDVVGTLNSQVTPDIVNTALVQWGRRHYNFPGDTGQPNLDIPNTLLFGHNFGVLDAIYESRVQATDSLAWVKGAHVIKFGVDINYIQNFVIWPGFTPMRIVLPGVNCLVDFANYVNSTKPAGSRGTPILSNFADGPCPLALPPTGNPGLNGGSPFPTVPGPNPADIENGVPIVFWGAPIGSGPVPAPGQPGFPTFPPPIPTNWQNAYLPSQTANFSETLNHSYYGFYAQDQWRITPKLTVNYGLRYDFEEGLYKQINPDYKGFQPRVGLAYSPNRHTVIRAGFGLFDDRYNLSFLFITQPQRPATLPGLPLPGLPNPLEGIRQGADTATWTLNQLPFGIPGAPSPANTATDMILNGQYLVPNNTLAPTTVGNGMVDRNSKIPYSEQASLEIDHELGKGFVLSAGYLFVSAHKIVRAENLNVCPVAGVSTGPYQCPKGGVPLPGWPAGKNYYNNGVLYPSGLMYYTDNSGNSIYHGLTVSANQHLGNYFRLNANYTFSKTLDDGTFTTFVSTPQDLYNRALERANSNQDIRNRFIANFTADGPSTSFVRNFEFSSIVTAQSGRPFTMFVGFDANGDTNPVTDRVGDAARNTYWGDSLIAWDLRVSRFFTFRERQRIELAMDAFNALNRANVNEVTSVYGTYNFCNGQVPSHYLDKASLAIERVQNVGGCPAAGPPVPNPLFGGPRTMFNPRQFQFSLKYSF
ncbi:MAG TPA: TonB-dependent receptor [Candidatus Methylomirabilis sp.]|nr:TonB-dependent receptor [Candidatus Methylomirabilis sp.]